MHKKIIFKTNNSLLSTIYFVLFIISFLLSTKPNSSYSESINDVIRKVIENSPEMKIASYDKKMSEYDKKMTMSAFLPRINFDTILSEENTEQVKNSLLAGKPTTQVSKESKKNGSMVFGLRYPFFNSGATVLQYRAADLSYTSQSFAEENKRREMIYEAVNAYIGVLETSLIQEMYKKTVQSAKTTLDIAKERLKLGSYSNRELADIASQYSSTVSLYAQYSADLDNAIIKYQNLVGEPPVIANLEQPIEIFNPSTLIEPLEKAMKYNPSANQASLSKKISSLQQKQAFVSEHLPYASLNSSWTIAKSSEDYFDFKRKNDTYFSVDFTIPLFNGFYGIYNVKKASAKALKAEEARIKTLRDLNTNVSDAWYQLKKSHHISEAKKDEVEAGLLQLKATKSERDLNQQTDLDVLEAEIEWLESKVDLIRAEYNSVRLSYKLLLLVGDSTDILELY